MCKTTLTHLRLTLPKLSQERSRGSLIVSSLAVQGMKGLKNLINSDNFTEDWNERNIVIAKQYEKENPKNPYF